MIFPDLLVRYIKFSELSKCLCGGTDIVYKNISSFYEKFLIRKGVPLFGKWNPEGAIAEPEDIVPDTSFTLKDIEGRHIGFIYKNSPHAVEEIHRLNKKYINRVKYSPDDFQLVLIGDKDDVYDSESRMLELNASNIYSWNPQCIFTVPSWADWNDNNDDDDGIKRDCKVAKEIKEKGEEYYILWGKYAFRLFIDGRFLRIEDGKLLWKQEKWELAYWCRYVGEKCKLYETDNINWQPFDNLFHAKNKNGELVPISARNLGKSFSAHFSKQKEDKIPDTLKPLLEEY